jgi:hypothetical protein
MKGSIRAIFGFLCVFGAVGGVDNATDGELGLALSIALLGCAIMYSGVSSMKGTR